ncbi:MAG: hypothetical protein JEZ07_10000 [Phycisphaerae bacterium]|nr:hypothetical protein [Phycisphaerae bacterium]
MKLKKSTFVILMMLAAVASLMFEFSGGYRDSELPVSVGMIIVCYWATILIGLKGVKALPQRFSFDMRLGISILAVIAMALPAILFCEVYYYKVGIGDGTGFGLIALCVLLKPAS